VALIYCTAQLSGSTDGTEHFHPTSEQWFVDDFEAYRGTDVGVFIFEALRGNYCLYPLQDRDVGSPDNRWGDDWVDPLAAFTRLAHSRPHEDPRRHAHDRAAISDDPRAHRSGPALLEEPRVTKRDRQGRPVGNLSPGVSRRTPILAEPAARDTRLRRRWNPPAP
jgi:hypothetical protein